MVLNKMMMSILILFSGNIYAQTNNDILKLVTSTIKENSVINNPVDAETFNLIVLQAGIRNLYADEKPMYKTISNSIALSAKVVPLAMKQKDSTTLTSKFGVVTITPNFDNDKQNDMFAINYFNVPKKECNRLIWNVFNQFTQIKVEQNILVINKKITNCTKNKNTITFNSI